MKMTVLNKRKIQKMSISINDQSDLIDILKHLSTIHRDQFNNRRIAELQIIIPLLTFYVITTYAILKDSISFGEYWPYLYILLMFIDIVLAVFASRYLFEIHDKNHENKSIAETAENELMKMSGVNDLKKFAQRREIKLKNENSEGNWSLHWQIGFILLFASSSIIILLTTITKQVIT